MPSLVTAAALQLWPELSSEVTPLKVIVRSLAVDIVMLQLRGRKLRGELASLP